MSKTINYLIILIPLIILLIHYIGLFIYKKGKCNTTSWEEGIKMVYKSIVSLISNFISWCLSSTPPDKAINTILCLQDFEYLEILNRLREHPFDTPTLLGFYQDFNNHVLKIEVSAVCLVSKYKDISNSMIEEIVTNLVQTYYLETRKCKVDVFLPVVSPKYICIAIPLSSYGKEILMEKQASSKEYAPDNRSILLEEEVNIFEDKEDKN